MSSTLHNYFVTDFPPVSYRVFISISKEIINILLYLLITKLTFYLFVFTDPYYQVDCVGREGIADLPKRPMNSSTTYFLSAFQTEGNLSTLERTWRSWSGADYLLWKCPDELKLNRITLYKKIHPETKFTFLVICECSEGLSHIHKAKDFLERLKERRCGYVSLYRVDRFY